MVLTLSCGLTIQSDLLHNPAQTIPPTILHQTIPSGHHSSLPSWPQLRASSMGLGVQNWGETVTYGGSEISTLGLQTQEHGLSFSFCLGAEDHLPLSLQHCPNLSQLPQHLSVRRG